MFSWVCPRSDPYRRGILHVLHVVHGTGVPPLRAGRGRRRHPRRRPQPIIRVAPGRGRSAGDAGGGHSGGGRVLEAAGHLVGEEVVRGCGRGCRLLVHLLRVDLLVLYVVVLHLLLFGPRSRRYRPGPPHGVLPPAPRPAVVLRHAEGTRCSRASTPNTRQPRCTNNFSSGPTQPRTDHRPSPCATPCYSSMSRSSSVYRQPTTWTPTRIYPQRPSEDCAPSLLLLRRTPGSATRKLRQTRSPFLFLHQFFSVQSPSS